MKRIAVLLAVVTPLVPLQAVLANASVGFERDNPARAARELPPYLQCVPYARQLTGIQIYGDAHTWWDQAAGRYERGRTPKVGAVMTFVPHRNMQLGHVAAVSRVIDRRTVLLDHANWSPIDGRRGQIERDVKAVDVSPANDWSEVRVWYGPQGGLGTTAWPVHGFIYSKRARLDRMQVAAAPARPVQASPVQASPVPTPVPTPAPAPVQAPVQAPVRAEPSRQFASAFAGFDSAPAARPAQLSAPVQAAPQRKPLPQARPAPQRRAPATQVRPATIDPIEAALARYSR